MRNHLRTLMEELYGAFGNAIEIILVSSDEPSFAGLAEEAEATFVRMNLRILCHGMAVHRSVFEGEDIEGKLLPSPSGAPVKMEQEDWLWISEDLELIHSSIGIEGEDDPKEYRLGADISWRNLQLRHDCDRDIAPMVQSRVEDELRRLQTVRVNVYHSPGSGGTTLGRRIAWDLRGRFPVGILKRCAVHDTADRIAKVAALTVTDFARHFPQFRSSPEVDRLAYERLDSHLSEGDARGGSRERFAAPGFEVELRWAPAGDAFFIVLPPERAATGRHEMYSLSFDVRDASVFLGGRRLPGAVTERKLHGRRAPSSFLALSETWVSGRS